MNEQSSIYYEEKEHKHARIIYEAGLNLYLTGPAGCGKTTFARLLAGLGNFYLVSCSSDMVPSHLIGHMELKNDNTAFVYGPLVRAMREGKVLILDEFDRVSEEVAAKCHEVLEAGQLLVEATAEMIYSHETFRIIATGNSKMQGSIQFNTLSLDLASIDRFEFVEFTYSSSETKILKDTGLPDETLDKLLSVSNTIRASEMLSVPLSTRRLKAIAFLILKGMTLKEALYYGFFSRLTKEEQDDFKRLDTMINARSEVWTMRANTPLEILNEISKYLATGEASIFHKTGTCVVTEELLKEKDKYLQFIETVQENKLGKTKGTKGVI